MGGAGRGAKPSRGSLSAGTGDTEAGENPDSQGRAVRSPPGPLGTAIKK